MKKILHFTIALMLLSGAAFAQTAPNLGTAANFVLFSTNGAVSNTGLSNFIGNIGSNNGAATNFGNVNGQMHSQDGATALCAADLLIAYQQLNAAIPTNFPGSTLGNGDTLTHGVYAIGASASLNLTLTLDGLNDPNAVFIFKIQGAFSSGALAKVKLINGALACNVFWKVEGLVNLAAGTTMRGTIIANNAAIILNTGDSLEGRAMSTTGAVTVHGVTSFIPVGCGSPVLDGPTAPPLGTTGCYALFSGNGAVANTGVTYVTGDIGTNVGLTLGFDSLLVNGTIHYNPDASTTQCATDLLVMYNYLNALPFDIELLYPAQFGSDLTLTPHTYLLNGATTFTDTVYLDAQGNSNAVFVIQANGPFATTNFALVKLINGTQAKNVFWKVGGAVNINTNTIFKGTIVANNGAVSLKTGAVLEGRAFTTSGALSTFTVKTTMPTPTCTILPVSWLSFSGKMTNENVVLNWATTNEVNNNFFTIERSNNGKTFEAISTIKTNSQVASGENHYSFNDTKPNAINYYRITQTDFNGKKTYSSVIQINVAVNTKALNYVVGENIYVQTTSANAGNGSIALYSIDGRKVAEQKIVLTKEAAIYKIAKPNYKGIYLLVVENAGQKIYSEKVIIL